VSLIFNPALTCQSVGEMDEVVRTRFVFCLQQRGGVVFVWSVWIRDGVVVDVVCEECSEMQLGEVEVGEGLMRTTRSC
jgi:hypothetical protein